MNENEKQPEIPKHPREEQVQQAIKVIDQNAQALAMQGLFTESAALLMALQVIRVLVTDHLASEMQRAQSAPKE